MIDNPPFKITNGTKITDFLYVGDFKLAYDSHFMQNQRVTHVINTRPSEIPNAFE